MQSQEATAQPLRCTLERCDRRIFGCPSAPSLTPAKLASSPQNSVAGDYCETVLFADCLPEASLLLVDVHPLSSTSASRLRTHDTVEPSRMDTRPRVASRAFMPEGPQQQQQQHSQHKVFAKDRKRERHKDIMEITDFSHHSVTPLFLSRAAFLRLTASFSKMDPRASACTIEGFPTRGRARISVVLCRVCSGVGSIQLA